MKPTYTLTIGAETADASYQSTGLHPVGIRVDLALGRINVAEVSGIPATAKAGDAVQVELGDRTAQGVFTGVVTAVAQNFQGGTLYCESSLAAFTNKRLNKLYEKQAAGAIISDLAQVCGVPTGQVDNGATYPVYVLGDGCSVWEHIKDLADREGFDAYAGPDDKLMVTAYTGATVHAFQYAMNILDLGIEQAPDALDGVEVYGESPSSHGQGAAAYAWLTKKEVKGSAGAAQGKVLRVADPALKDLNAAAAAAQNLYNRKRKALAGWMLTPGSAAVCLGDAIQISGTPGGRADGTFKVTRIVHRLDKTKGFTTKIYWQEP